MTSEKLVAEKLLQINAIRLNVQNPFTWASGWRSPIYCDNRRILSFPHTRDFIRSEMSNTVFTQFPDAELVAGVATAGIPHGVLVADQLKLPFVYVRSKAKEHGMGKQIEGDVQPGQKAVVIEDLVSTGRSSLDACRALQEAGVKIAGLVAVFSYGFETATSAFAEAGIPFAALSNYEVLIRLAAERGTVDAGQLEILREWRQAPEKWGR